MGEMAEYYSDPTYLKDPERRYTVSEQDFEHISGVRVDFERDKWIRDSFCVSFTDETGKRTEFGPYATRFGGRDVVTQYLEQPSSINVALRFVFDRESLFHPFTITSRRTGVAFTYRIEQPDRKRYAACGPFFLHVDVLGTFRFAGTFWRDPALRWKTAGRMRHVDPDHPAVAAFLWFFENVLRRRDLHALGRIEISR